MVTCDVEERVGPKADPFRTIQVHPTRKCNLSCLHCYSNSSPHYRDMLDVAALKRFLAYAREHGFNNLSLSGGEPFLYKDLEELLVFSHALGYQNTLATNGMLLQSDRNQRLLEHIDLIAVSIDGQPDLHDHIRGQKGAFDKMMQGVMVLQAHQKAFGFIHTVTPQSWESLLWLGEFAHDNGAKLLQLHPLEMYGRALDELTECTIDDTLAHQTFILATYLQSKYADSMIVQLDLLHREYLEMFPQVVDTFSRQCAQNGRLSDLIDNIIVEESGRILPVAYGFEDAYTIGNVLDFDQSLFDRYLREKMPDLKNLYQLTLAKVFSNNEIDIINWNEILVNESKTAVIHA